MAATKKEIGGWFDEGVAKGASHMLVLCDTYDYDDYPVFTKTDNDCLMQYRNPGNMQKVMEVYDLKADKAEQMKLHRAMRLPK